MMSIMKTVCSVLMIISAVNAIDLTFTTPNATSVYKNSDSITVQFKPTRNLWYNDVDIYLLRKRSTSIIYTIKKKTSNLKN